MKFLKTVAIQQKAFSVTDSFTFVFTPNWRTSPKIWTEKSAAAPKILIAFMPVSIRDC